MHVGETNSSNRELTALHGSAILSGQISRDSTMRDVLEMVLTCREVRYGIFRILGKMVRGYFAVADGNMIVGAHTTSTREYGIPALRELLSATEGMFVFAQLEEFPIEVRQSLSIPLNELLEWRPEGVPPNMVVMLAQALSPWEQRQAELENSECMDALRLGTMPGPVDAAQEEADFNSFWGGQPDEQVDATPAKPLSALVPKVEAAPPNPLAVTVEIVPPPIDEIAPDATPVKEEVAATWIPQPRPATPERPFTALPPQPQQFVPPVPPMPPEESLEGWSKSDLDAIGRVQAPQEEEVKSGLAHSGRFKAADAEDPLSRSGRFVRDELTQSQRVHRPDPELSASGRFIAAELTAELLPSGGSAREYMEVEEKVSKPVDPVFVACCVVAVLVFGWMDFQIYTYMTGTAPSVLNKAAEEIRVGQLDAAMKDLDEALKSSPNKQFVKLTMAIALLDQDKCDEAIAKCDEILKDDPNAADALRTRATANAKLGKFNEAIADVDTYLSAAHDDEPTARAQALAVRAFANMKLQRFDDSIADYTKAIKLDEKNMHLFASRAAVNLMKQQKKK